MSEWPLPEITVASLTDVDQQVVPGPVVHQTSQHLCMHAACARTMLLPLSPLSDTRRLLWSTGVATKPTEPVNKCYTSHWHEQKTHEFGGPLGTSNLSTSSRSHCLKPKHIIAFPLPVGHGTFQELTRHEETYNLEAKRDIEATHNYTSSCALTTRMPSLMFSSLIVNTHSYLTRPRCMR